MAFTTATPAMLKVTYPLVDFARLTNPGTEPGSTPVAATADDAILTTQLARAYQAMTADNALECFDDTYDELLQGVQMDLAVYYLHLDCTDLEPNDTVRLRYEEAIKELERLHKICAVKDVATNTGAQFAYAFGGPGRSLTKESLDNYVNRLV